MLGGLKFCRSLTFEKKSLKYIFQRRGKAIYLQTKKLGKL